MLRLLAIPLILASVVGTGAAEDANDELFFDACIQSSSDRMRSLPPRLRSVYGFLVWTAIDEAAQACEDSNLSLGALVGKRLEDEGFYFTEGVEEAATDASRSSIRWPRRINSAVLEVTPASNFARAP